MSLKEKIALILFGLFIVMFITIVHLQTHSWDKMNQACRDLREPFEYCFLKSVEISPRKGIGTCVCVDESFGGYTIREQEIDFKGNFWYWLNSI